MAGKAYRQGPEQGDLNLPRMRSTKPDPVGTFEKSASRITQNMRGTAVPVQLASQRATSGSGMAEQGSFPPALHLPGVERSRRNGVAALPHLHIIHAAQDARWLRQFEKHLSPLSGRL